MKKALCIESDSYINFNKIDITICDGKLYYIVYNFQTDGIIFYNTYDYDTAEFLGVFSEEKFGPYELWIALQRDLKIDEILNG